MKAVITKVDFQKEIDTKFGLAYIYKLEYNGKEATYFSKSKDQAKFVKGKEAEFTEEKKGDYLNVKPVTVGKFSEYSRAIKREQSKYSGFGDSYIKDMLVGGVLLPEKTEEDLEHNDIVMITWKKRASEIFDHMVELDKSISK